MRTSAIGSSSATSDELTRCIKALAFAQLDNTYQAENEPFRDFIHRWEAKEFELGDRLDEMLRIAFVLNRLLPDVSREIEVGGAPETWEELKRRGFADKNDETGREWDKNDETGREWDKNDETGREWDKNDETG
ncbi:hypothetical protein MY11210_000128 [Beauveria gryllotalpidicola]